MLRFVAVLSTCVMLLVGGIGCGKSHPYPVGEVSGTLTLRGKPAPSNLEIFFMSQKTGAAYKALVDADGKFAVDQPVRVGEYVAYVQPAVDRNLDMSAPPKSASMSSSIPGKYANDSKSDLHANVQEGDNDFQFDMK